MCRPWTNGDGDGDGDGDDDGDGDKRDGSYVSRNCREEPQDERIMCVDIPRTNRHT